MAQNTNNHVLSDNPMRAMGYAAVTFFLFAVMGALTKIMTETHHVAEIIFWRNALTLVPLALFLYFKNKSLFKIAMPKRLAIRCVGGITSMAITFYALENLHFTDFTVFTFLATLLTPLGAHYILKERVGKHRMFAIFIGLLGALIIVQPSGSSVTYLGAILGVATAASHSAMYLVIRTLKSMHAITVTFYFILTGTIMAGVLMPWLMQTPTAIDLLFFAAIGVFGGLGQFCLTTANHSGSPALVVPFNYTGLIWATGFDILIWNHFPSLTVYIGALIIIAAKAYILYREHIKAKEQNGKR